MIRIIFALLLLSFQAHAVLVFMTGAVFADDKFVCSTVEECLPQAEMGNAEAQYRLGALYSHGYGVPQDYVAAREWYLAAAEQGQAEAQHNLGALYSKGEDISQDYVEARKWWRKAADHNYPKSQYNLGLLHYNGQGVPQDYAEARKWWLKAAAQDQTQTDAPYMLGVLYNNGQGVLRDYAEASKWYLKAAQLGDADAQFSLGFLYGKDGDYVQARKWFLQAAKQAHVKAQYGLGILYGNGQGVQQDHVTAYAWLNIAAVQDYEPAKNDRDALANVLNQNASLAEAQELSKEYYKIYVEPFL